MATSFALLALSAAAAVNAVLTPTAPGPGDVFQAGGVCSYSYTPDPTGQWRNVSIDLMTGSNFDMQLVENIASHVDGTSSGGATGQGSFTCPQVTINAAVYFLQFTNNGADPTWTTRFTIASSSGATQAAPSSTVAEGTTIGYGYGSLAGGAASGAASGGAAATSTASAVTVTSTDSSFSPAASASASAGASDDSSASSTAGNSASFSSASGTRSAASATGSSGKSNGAGKTAVGGLSALLGLSGVVAFFL